MNIFGKFFQKQDMWLMLIEKSMKEWDIDEAYIKKLLKNFDTENLRFNLP